VTLPPLTFDTLDEVRLLATEHLDWVPDVQAQRARFAALRIKRAMRRITVPDAPPQYRVWMYGPRWRSTFGVQPLLLPCNPFEPPPRRPVLVYDCFADVLERVFAGREIRPGIFAEWWD
jgi:hypothetical protein